MNKFKYLNIEILKYCRRFRGGSGQSVFEVLIALGVFAVAALSAFQIFFGGQKLSS
mgnify:CR=1 FL=1